MLWFRWEHHDDHSTREELKALVARNFNTTSTSSWQNGSDLKKVGKAVEDQINFWKSSTAMVKIKVRAPSRRPFQEIGFTIYGGGGIHHKQGAKTNEMQTTSEEDIIAEEEDYTNGKKSGSGGYPSFIADKDKVAPNEGRLGRCASSSGPGCGFQGFPWGSFTVGTRGGGSDSVASEPHGEQFERGGAAESGSGGGPGDPVGSESSGGGPRSFEESGGVARELFQKIQERR